MWARARSFDKNNNIGLHHTVIRVASLEILDTIFHKLDGVENVEIEFVPEPCERGR